MKTSCLKILCFSVGFVLALGYAAYVLPEAILFLMAILTSLFWAIILLPAERTSTHCWIINKIILLWN